MKLAIILLSFLAAFSAQAIDTTAIDAEIQKYVDAGQFSGTVLLAKDNKVVFSKGYGLAVRNHGIPNARETVFRIGSLSKQFTAAAVLRLQSEGKLRVKDKVSKYLDLPKEWRDVTIHQLLSHSSGLDRDLMPFCDRLNDELEVCLKKHARWEGYRTLGMLFDVLKSNAQITSKKIGQYHYSNAGYTLLAKLVHSLSGQKDEMFGYELSMNSFFQNIGLQKTEVESGLTPALNQAEAYVPYEGGWYRYSGPNPSNFAGAGDIRSTVDDLFKWHLALEREGVLGPSEKEAMYSRHVPFPENECPRCYYGYGWATKLVEGERHIFHDGITGGFTSYMVRVPARGLVWIALGNIRTIPHSAIQKSVFELVRKGARTSKGEE